MLTSRGSPLVVGAAQTNMADQTVTIKVLRAFLLKSERQEVGKVMQIEQRLAAELVGLNKAEVLRDPPAAKTTKAREPASPAKE